jgi:hypothetical protein
MPRGARLTAREKAQQAVEKQQAKVDRLHERGKKLAAELHQLEADWRAENETLQYLKTHPALTGVVYGEGGVDAPEPIVRTGQVDEMIGVVEPEQLEKANEAFIEKHFGPTTIGEEVQRELDELPGMWEQSDLEGGEADTAEARDDLPQLDKIAPNLNPKLTPNQVDPRDEPGEQLPPIKYDPPKSEPPEQRERFVAADPFA